jgi:hypothetical protein
MFRIFIVFVLSLLVIPIGSIGLKINLIGKVAASGADATQDKAQKSSSNPVYAQLRTLGLSGESVPVEDFVLKRDTATITLNRGELFFLSPVEGKVTGAVFIGQGEFQLSPILTMEQKQLAILTGSPSITEKFSKMVLRFTDSTYEEVKKAGGLKTGQPNSNAQSILEDNRKFLRNGKLYRAPNIAAGFLHYNLDARIFLDLTWPEQQGFFQAYFDGKQYGDWLFSLDPLGAPFVTPEEIVLVCLSDNNLGVWVASHLQAHYKDKGVFDENHQLIDLVHHNIDATIKGKRLDAVVETRFKSMVNGARVVSFDLFPYLRVRKVTDSSGRELGFIQEDKEKDPDFYVILAEPLKKGQEYTLKFEYGGDDAVIDGGGGGNYTLAARSNWYPNSFFGDRATYEMTLRTPKGLTMVATGTPISDTVEKDLQVTKWKSDTELAVAGFNYGKFKKSAIKDEKLNYDIEAYANKELPSIFKTIQRVGEENANDPISTLGSLNTVVLMDKARAEAQLSMELYSALFGPLPYGRIAMTQQPFPFFGQAWPTLIYMPITAYFDSTQRHTLGIDDSSFFQIVAPHEVAHQWWGHIIGWKTYRDQWMSEGFSEFSASMFAQAYYKNERFIEFWKEERQLITTKNQLGKRPSDVGGVYMGYRLDTPKTGNVTRAMIYPKGAFILHMLRMMMWDPKKTGDQRFSEMMKDFVKTYYNQNVSTQDFWNIVNKHMLPEMDLEGNGKMNWFFTQWVYGTTVPHYKFEYRLDPGENGQVKLVAKITQTQVDGNFRMIVPVYADFDGKVTRLGTVAITGNTTTAPIQVMLPKKPKRVMINYFEDVLCTMDDR